MRKSRQRALKREFERYHGRPVNGVVFPEKPRVLPANVTQEQIDEFFNFHPYIPSEWRRLKKARNV